MSSAKRRLERNSPSIFTPLFSQFNLLNMLSNVAVNSLGEMVSYFSLDPDFLTLFFISVKNKALSPGNKVTSALRLLLLSPWVI